MKRHQVFAVAGLMLASCNTVPEGSKASILPEPVVAYSCQDGTQLLVKLLGATAQVGVNGAAPISLPNMGQTGTTYSNGRQTLTIVQGRTSWALGKMMPVPCTGG